MDDPCVNNATCVDLVGGYSCICGPGWNGTNCEMNIQECSSDPCQNNATCIGAIGSYQCVCPPGWTGSTCGLGMFLILFIYLFLLLITDLITDNLLICCYMLWILLNL